MAEAAGVAGEHLRRYVERIERLEEERAEIAGHIREVYSEAKANGFDVPTLRQVVKLRKLDSADRAEREALLDLYKSALGLVG
ncbi:MAG: DUF2312 domain-containing protein [Alphaproteobacteria bacterium]